VLHRRLHRAVERTMLLATEAAAIIISTEGKKREEE
jgi:hypothetical protein